jgi:hypothetical protein
MFRFFFSFCLFTIMGAGASSGIFVSCLFSYCCFLSTFHSLTAVSMGVTLQRRLNRRAVFSFKFLMVTSCYTLGGPIFLVMLVARPLRLSFAHW